jgi:hypothetical protein
MQLGGWANDDLVDALSELNRRLGAASEDRWSDVTAEGLMLLTNAFQMGGGIATRNSSGEL